MQELIDSRPMMDATAARFVQGITPHADGATVVALEGELGSGKTTFVQGVARAVGVTESVTSPTFVLEKIYKLMGQPFDHLVHIDAYRLDGVQEADALGWHELLANSRNLICLEWPERLGSAVPKDAVRLQFRFVSDTVRELTWPQ